MELIKKKVILITEDEPAMMRALSDSLERAGFAVIPAKDGREGLASHSRRCDAERDV